MPGFVVTWFAIGASLFLLGRMGVGVLIVFVTPNEQQWS